MCLKFCIDIKGFTKYVPGVFRSFEEKARMVLVSLFVFNEIVFKFFNM